jgi:glycosyltransferase involved in cell wall biosynthesis
MNKSPVAHPSALLVSCGAWYLRQTAHAFHSRSALAGLWIADKNSTAIPQELFRRCWPFHLCMKPFYHLAPQIVVERMLYALFPVWRQWFLQQSLPRCEVVHAIIGYGTEAFAKAEQIGALKVVDCPNSHPTSYFGYWQRECDIWCQGEKVPIPRWMFARMNRELELADLIMVQSKFGKDSMVSNGIPADKVFVNPMGVDTALFTKRPAAPSKVRFVCVGTICLRKGHQYLFRAWKIVKRELPDAELVCVGEYKNDFRKERPKWKNEFTHIPRLTHPELADLLRNCTAFVFPSQEEGIARAQMEALACGLPVIGTHEGGATTLVDDGVEGFIVRGREPEDIAAAMIRCASDRAINQRMGEAAYQKGAIQNSWQDYGDRLLREYKKRLPSRM